MWLCSTSGRESLPDQPGVEVRLARAHRLDAVGDAGGLELAGQELGARELVAGRLAGVDPHVLLEQLDLRQVGVVAVDPLLGLAATQGRVEELDHAPGQQPATRTRLPYRAIRAACRRRVSSFCRIMRPAMINPSPPVVYASLEFGGANG